MAYVAHVAAPSWKARIEDLETVCQRVGAGDRDLGARGSARFEIGPPARLGDIEAVEAELGVELPMSFRKVLLAFSGRMLVSWQLPRDRKPPKPLHQIFSGECSWDLERLTSMQAEYREMLYTAFDDPEDEYGAVWHDKLPFLDVGNGDYLAIDVASAEDETVVYLSHDDDDGHGYRLGETFADFVDRLTRLGCVGPEAWQYMPFMDGPNSYLLPDCENGKVWREWLGFADAG